MKNQQSHWLYDNGLNLSLEFDRPNAWHGRTNEDWRMSLESTREVLINSPAVADTYMPPVVPANWNRFSSQTTQKLMTLSAQAVIAEIWTHFLERKFDKKEVPIRLLWDEDVPLPNPLTSLFWLMTCESWPMIAAVPNYPNENLSDIFPPQSFVLPQSSHKLYSTQYPPEFTQGHILARGAPSLDVLLNEHMTREDRTLMNKASQSTRVYRPQYNYVTYWQHSVVDKRRRFLHQWNDDRGWPVTPIGMLDSGVVMIEHQSSWHHMQHVMRLRANLMQNIITRPGLPTHHNSLYVCQGGWIRGWSEVGLQVSSPAGLLSWTLDNESITLESGARLNAVPNRAPNVWFGFTHIGPDYKVENGKPERIVTASEKWVEAYLQHRNTALEMFFESEKMLDMISSMVTAHTIGRARKLERAGRIIKSAEQEKKSFASNMKNIFGNITKE